jgi:hypothetical protein
MEAGDCRKMQKTSGGSKSLYPKPAQSTTSACVLNRPVVLLWGYAFRFQTITRIVDFALLHENERHGSSGYREVRTINSRKRTRRAVKDMIVAPDIGAVARRRYQRLVRPKRWLGRWIADCCPLSASE